MVSVRAIANNQYIISVDDRKVFQSYNSKVAEKNDGQIILYEPYWNMFSATTNKYLLRFLGELSIKDVRAKVESGEYTVL
jgi:hypothetical protein|tara:strand:+ start:234 stop:473 length:240 start_codon:yes stop_codon:yes gene_type:complete